MKPSLRRILAVTAPVAVLAAASTASAGLLATPSYLTDNKVYPTVVNTDGSSYVDVAVRWAPHLLRRGKTSHQMRVTLTGKGRKGAPIRFDAKTIKRGSGKYEVVRLRIKKAQRGAYANARNVVVSAAHHWDSPTDADTNSNLAAVSNTNVKGTTRKGQFSLRAAKDCDVATLGPGVDASGCDFAGQPLAGLNLKGANLSNTILDLANLAGANLDGANVTGASMVGTNIAGANFGATSQAAFTMPQAADPSQASSAACKTTGGGPMCEAIYSAKSTIGAVYYQFAGPNVTTWLQDALRRGVNVFIIENSANTVGGTSTNPLCQTVTALDPTCAWSPKADPFYALEYQLKSTTMADGKTPAPGKVRVQFSSENFNITHQKSILVDVLDPSGKALDAGTIQANGGSAVVSTGNLQAFPNAWGQRTMSVNGTQKVVNPQYLTRPNDSCVFGPGGKCTAEWTPRDFAMKVTDPAILARVAGVYASDLACDGSDVTNLQRVVGGTLVPGFIADPKNSDPISAAWPETWSNGSQYTDWDKLPPNPQKPWNYPIPGVSPNGYFAKTGSGTSTTYYSPSYNTGNVRARQLQLIGKATKTLIVYNEEMSDSGITNALIAAGQRGVKVTIVMANKFWTPPNSSTPVPDQNKYVTKWASNFNSITAASSYTAPNAQVPQIQLLDSDGALYIHAKAIIADGVDGWFGSINASGPSMNDNRELGIGVTTRSDGSTPYVPSTYSPQMINAVTTAAASDAAAGTSWTKGQPSPSTMRGASGSYMDSAQFPCINTQANPLSGLPARDPNNIAVPPQAPVTP